MQRAIKQRVLGQPFDRLGGGTHERRHRGMIQVDKVVRYRKLAAVGLQIFETHLTEHTL